MPTALDILPADATEVQHDYLEEVVDATRLANGAYDDISTEDIVAVLRHRATLYNEYGLDAIHPRNQSDDDELPTLEGLFTQTETGLESTDRRWFNVDVGFKTGLMHGQDITDEEMADVLTVLAEYIEDHGRTVVGSREPHSDDTE